jgi:serine/threonine protein phosphatase PrpC
MLAQQAMCACTHSTNFFDRLQVFDGHCGNHAAEFASSRILEGVTGHSRFPVDIPATLVRGLLQHCAA